MNTKLIFMARVLATLALLLAAFILPAAAQAVAVQDDQGFYSLLRPYFAEMLGIVATGVIAWIAALVQRWTGIQVEAKHREALQSALTNAALVAAERGARAGIDYVMHSVPDAVKKFNLTEEGVARLLKPKMTDIALKTGAVLPPPRTPPGHLDH